MEISEFEKKRAANLIWNGAKDYSAEPGFRVYDEEGRADVYWNSIVGAAHRHYDWGKLEQFYHTFNETVNQGVYESLFWLALENATYLKEKDERPVFPWLRHQYAAGAVEHLHGSFACVLIDGLFCDDVHGFRDEGCLVCRLGRVRHRVDAVGIALCPNRAERKK